MTRAIRKKYQKKSQGPGVVERGTVRTSLSEEVTFKVRAECGGTQPGEGREVGWKHSIPGVSTGSERMGGLQFGILHSEVSPHWMGA